MGGFQTDAPNSFGWAELNARGIDKAIPFYTSVFGWTTRTSEMGEGQPPYTEFLLDGESVAGAWEMNPMVPAEVPSYWQVYFAVDDVDAAFKKAIDAGARELQAPQDFPGGRFAIVSDPQGASSACSRPRLAERSQRYGENPSDRRRGSSSAGSRTRKRREDHDGKCSPPLCSSS